MNKKRSAVKHVKNFSYSDELYHFGIKGMKWGIRRWQNEDGSLTPEGKIHYGYGEGDNRKIIPKGSYVYRTSVNKKEGGSGHAYVSIAEVDRNHYKGGAGAAWLRNLSGDENANLYEHRYKLKEDLKVAQKEDIIEVLNNLTKEEKAIINKASEDAYTKTGMDFYKQFSRDHDYDNFYDDALSKLLKNGKKYSDLTIDELDYASNNAEKKMEKQYQKLTNDLIKQYSNLSINDAFELGTARSFGSNEKARRIVTEKLKSKGFNAMIDQAGIGTSSDSQVNIGTNEKFKITEGVAPTIIFDRDIMESKGDHKVSKKESFKAERNYNRWAYSK